MSTVATEIYTARYRELIRKFPLRTLRTKKEARAATEILDVLFGKQHTDAGEEAYTHVLATLLADYEDEYESFPNTATGLDVLKHLAEEHGLKQADLSKVLGIGQSAVSLILSGERPITAEHARTLGKRFKVAPGLFI